MTRRYLLACVLALAVGGCTKIYNDPESAGAVPTVPSPVKIDKVEFRVIGANISTFTPVTIRHTDALNGLTLYTGGLPYFTQFASVDDNVFLYVEAQAAGNLSTSTLLVQIFVNGKLFRDGFSQGFSLSAQTSGTYRR